MQLFLTKTKARREFKEKLGNANHLIITALVGLNAIERGIVKRIPDELRMAWNPINAKNSAQRSRRLILDLALIRAVDALDIYINTARRKPNLFRNIDLTKKIDGSGLSISEKFSAVSSHFYRIDRVLVAMTSLVIAWRNKAAHSESQNTITEDERRLLIANSKNIFDRFRHLNIEQLLDGFERNHTPTFKELASLINAIHHFVNELEKYQFAEIENEFEALLKEIILVGPHNNDFLELKKSERLKSIKSIWGRDESKKSSQIVSLLQHCGFSLIKPKLEANCIILDDYILQKITAMTPAEITNWLNK